MGVKEIETLDKKKVWYALSANRQAYLPVLLLAGARMMLWMALPLDGLRGYGDFLNFFHVASLPGWPYINFWVEFPPIFPFLSKTIYLISGGQEHVFTSLLFLILTVVDCLNLAIFIWLVGRAAPQIGANHRVLTYLVILCSLAYQWWYFDPLAVFFMLAGLMLWFKQKPVFCGLAIAAGILTKLFPILLLPVLWKNGSRRSSLLATGAAVALSLTVLIGLYSYSPEMTKASLISQQNKGSWETVWALIDGNLRTGNFGDLIERLDASGTGQVSGNPPRIPVMISLAIFLGFGLWIFLRSRLDQPNRMLSFLGFTWCLFLLWSPGWSPQWVIYLIPIILLALPARRGILFSLLLILVNLLEWPVLLSRGFFEGLWGTVLLRTALFALLGFAFYEQMNTAKIQPSLETSPGSP